MRSMVEALGVRKKGGCLFCHVKVGNKPQFRLDTPQKDIVRQMKTDFIDSLAVKGQAEILLVEEGDTTQVLAFMQNRGNTTRISLRAIAADSSTYETFVALANPDAPLTCTTCHAGQTHLFPQLHGHGN
ncbi:MAG: hypothetical protein GKR89_31065 [Candidatus Latescibacteria bacterium]|nr:hypothetical protein [Candidatus Latescibacterota bacterium]